MSTQFSVSPFGLIIKLFHWPHARDAAKDITKTIKIKFRLIIFKLTKIVPIYDICAI
jgi:hypothetical protein